MDSAGCPPRLPLLDSLKLQEGTLDSATQLPILRSTLPVMDSALSFTPEQGGSFVTLCPPRGGL